MGKRPIPPLVPETADGSATLIKLTTVSALPPIVAEVAGGSVRWQRLEGLDYDFLGYFLCCHLIIEHYLDEFLRGTYPSLSWEKARPSFSQKLSLLSDSSEFKASKKYDLIPPIKSLNALRNKLIHNISYKMGVEDLLPLKQFLTKLFEEHAKPVPDDPKGILEQFTMMVCSYLGGAISFNAQSKTPRQYTR